MGHAVAYMLSIYSRQSLRPCQLYPYANNPDSSAGYFIAEHLGCAIHVGAFAGMVITFLIVARAIFQNNFEIRDPVTTHDSKIDVRSIQNLFLSRKEKC